MNKDEIITFFIGLFWVIVIIGISANTVPSLGMIGCYILGFEIEKLFKKSKK